MKECSCAEVKDFTVSGRAEDRAADGLVAEGRLGEAVEDDVVGRIVGGADLLQDDVLLALQLFGVELGFRQDVGQDVDGQRHVVAKHARVEGGRLDAGRGIDLAADILDLRGDLPGAAPFGALEGHVLEQMGDAVFVVGARCGRPT